MLGLEGAGVFFAGAGAGTGLVVDGADAAGLVEGTSVETVGAGYFFSATWNFLPRAWATSSSLGSSTTLCSPDAWYESSGKYWSRE